MFIFKLTNNMDGETWERWDTYLQERTKDEGGSILLHKDIDLIAVNQDVAPNDDNDFIFDIGGGEE